MQEMITLKKHRTPIWQILLSALLSVGFYFLQDRSTRHYLTGRMKGTFSGGENALWFTLTLLTIYATMMALTFFLSALLRLLLDREAFVAVRKSSMENSRAAAIYGECKKKLRKIRVLNDAATFGVISLILTFYLTNRTNNTVLLWFAIISAILLMSFNPVAIRQKQKAKAPVLQVLTNECDPVTAYDIAEHFRLDPQSQAEKEVTIMQQAAYSFYAGDYPEMSRKLSQCGGKLYGRNKMIYILYKGLYALDTGDMNGYYACVGEMNAQESARKLSPTDSTLLSDMRNEWQLRLSLINCAPQDVIPAVMQQLSRDKTVADRMDHTFQLGWLQLQVGDTMQGQQNLQIVANGAGTMAIREKAQKLLG